MSSYRNALQRYERHGANADAEARTAAYCRDHLQMDLGSIVNVEMVFRGAVRKGILLDDLKRLVSRSPQAIVELQWAR